MKLYLLVILSFYFPNDTLAKKCEKIRIACTPSYGCPADLRTAITKVGSKRKIEASYLSLQNQSQLRSPDEYDALISPGGKDIHFEFYGDLIEDPELREKTRKYFEQTKAKRTTKASYARDRFEISFFQRYFDDQDPEVEDFKKKPVLGICYGSQMLGVVHKIPLIADMLTFLNIPASYLKKDLIHFKPDSLFGEFFEGDSFYGNENHHQTLDASYFVRHPEVATEASLMATSHQGKVVEGILYPKRPALGIQFHPELLLKRSEEDAESLKVRDQIFGWLLDRACDHQS